MKPTFDRTTPAGADQYFTYCINTADLKLAIECFDAKAVYVDKEGTIITGLANIEKAMEKLISLKPVLTGIKHFDIVADENLALWLDGWTLAGSQPGNTPVQLNSGSTCIMRKGSDGYWRWLVDNPFAQTFFTK